MVLFRRTRQTGNAAPRALVALALALSALMPSQAIAINQGMVLVTENPNQNTWRGAGPMYLIYLSTGERVLLDETPQRDGTFSPDGRKIAYHDMGTKPMAVVTMHIDGTGKRGIRSASLNETWAPLLDWPTPDHIYAAWGIPHVIRFRADGVGEVEKLFRAPDGPNWKGEMTVPDIARIQVSNDESLIAVTADRRRCLLFNAAGDLLCESTRGCNTGIAPSGTIWCNFTLSHTWAHIRTTAQPCDEERRISLPAPYEGRAWNYMHFGTGTDDLLLMTTEEKPYVGLIYDLRTDTVHTLGSYLIHDYFPQEIHLDSEAPRLALSTTQLTFTAQAGGTPTPESIDIAVTNDAGGTLGAVTVSGAPAWLNVGVQGSGNAQTLVNAVAAQNLPVDSSVVMADIQVAAANAEAPESYKVTVYRVQMRAPDVLENPATGLEYGIYAGTYSGIPDITTVTPSDSGADAEFSQVPLPATDALVRVSGFVPAGASDIYTFTMHTDSATAWRVSIGETVVAGSGQDTIPIGLEAGLHAITIEWLHVPGQGHPVVSMAAPGAAPDTIDAQLIRDLGAGNTGITVVTPNGGEHYRIGTTMTIEWQADCIAFGSLDIAVSVNDGESWQSILPAAAVECESGSFDWTVPSTLGSESTESQHCLVKVKHYNGPEHDLSDMHFTISKDGAAVDPADRTRAARIAPSVTVTGGVIAVGNAGGNNTRVRVLDVRGRTVAILTVGGDGRMGKSRAAPGSGVYVYEVEHGAGSVRNRVPVTR